MVANKSEVPILSNIVLQCNLKIDNNSPTFEIPFAVANVKYNILGTPFLDKYIKSFDIENMTLNFKTSISPPIPPTPFVFLKDKDYPYFSYIYSIKVSRPLNFESNTSKIVHFPLPNTKNLSFITHTNEKISPTLPHPYFNKKYTHLFTFLEILPKDSGLNNCTVLIQNTTNHPTTLPKGTLGYIELPASLHRPPYYQVQDINTFIHSLIHTYHPEITEPIPHPRSSFLKSS